MSKKTEKKTSEKPEKETAMRFDRNWIPPMGKRGIVAQFEKRAKSAPVLMTPEELDRYNQKMAPKRARRLKNRELKKLGEKIVAHQTTQESAHVSA